MTTAPKPFSTHAIPPELPAVISTWPSQPGPGGWYHQFYDPNDRHPDLAGLTMRREGSSVVVEGTFDAGCATLGDEWHGWMWLEHGTAEDDQFISDAVLGVRFGNGDPLVQYWEGNELIAEGPATVEIAGASLTATFDQGLLRFGPNAIGMSAVAYPNCLPEQPCALSSMWLAPMACTESPLAARIAPPPTR